MRYFTKLTQDHCVCKNNYQKAVRKLLQREERKVLESKEVAQIHMQQMLDTINIDLKAEHARCKPIYAYQWDSIFFVQPNDLCLIAGTAGQLQYYAEQPD